MKPVHPNTPILILLCLAIALSCERDDYYASSGPSIPKLSDSSLFYLKPLEFTITSGNELRQEKSLANRNLQYLRNFILRVQNGSSNRTKVSGVEILVDGNTVVAGSDFSNTFLVSKPIPALTQSSVLEVRLSGHQGAFIRLQVESSLKPGVITDIDSNYYNTVKIGNNSWTTENLRVTRYNDGTPLQYVTDDSTWANMDLIYKGCYCFYNDDSTFKDTYGALYNWAAAGKVEDKELCPAGWHVAEFEELWDAILVYDPSAPYIYDRTIGGEFKEKGTSHWESPNTGATNRSGFTGLPGGSRDGKFAGMGKSGIWWLGYGEWFGLMYNNNRIGYIYDVYSGGHSVRCVKDRR